MTKSHLNFLVISFGFITYCLGSCQAANNKHDTYRYVHENCSLIIELSNDSLVGSHIFNEYNGNRIDWCENEPSIRAIRKKNNVFEGVIRNCYDAELEFLKIRIEYYIDSLKLYFLDPHPFLEDSIITFVLAPLETMSISELRTYSNETNGRKEVSIQLIGDSLVGAHFWGEYMKGNIYYLEFCDEDVTILALKNNNIFEGTIQCCFGEDKSRLLKIRIKYSEDEIILSFLEKHPFLEDTIILKSDE